MNMKKTVPDSRCKSIKADVFIKVINEMRNDRPSEITAEYLTGNFKNDGLARELLILFDPFTDYKTAKIDYYYKETTSGKFTISPKMYPTRAIGKILKYISANNVQYLTRYNLKTNIVISYNKAWASLLCLLYLGFATIIPDTTGECFPTNKIAEFSSYSLPKHITGQN